MGKVKDKLLELEEAGIIMWSDDTDSYVLVADLPDPQPFDLAEYLFKLSVNKDLELRTLIADKYSVTVLGDDYVEMSIIQCVINTVRNFDKED